MDEMVEKLSNGKSVESTVKITRKEFEDGSSEETRVEQVEGGYIITFLVRSTLHWLGTSMQQSIGFTNSNSKQDNVCNTYGSILRFLLYSLRIHNARWPLIKSVKNSYENEDSIEFIAKASSI